MDPLIYSRSSDEPPLLNDAVPNWELPVDADYRPQEIRCSPDEILALSASYLPRWASRPECRARRIADACPEEFDLEHPERVEPRYATELLNALLDD